MASMRMNDDKNGRGTRGEGRGARVVEMDKSSGIKQQVKV